MAKTDKDYIIPVKPKKDSKPIPWELTAPDGDAAYKLAKRIAQRRGWKDAEIGKAQEKKP